MCVLGVFLVCSWESFLEEDEVQGSVRELGAGLYGLGESGRE